MDSLLPQRADRCLKEGRDFGLTLGKEGVTVHDVDDGQVPGTGSVRAELGDGAGGGQASQLPPQCAGAHCEVTDS